MSRSVLAILFATVCSSCAVDPIDPNIWSLALTDTEHNREVYLGGHYTLEACRKAGVDWYTEARPHSAVLQCRLNCRKMTKYGDVTCDAAEPVG